MLFWLNLILKLITYSYKQNNDDTDYVFWVQFFTEDGYCDRELLYSEELGQPPDVIILIIQT